MTTPNIIALCAVASYLVGLAVGRFLTRLSTEWQAGDMLGDFGAKATADARRTGSGGYQIAMMVGTDVKVTTTISAELIRPTQSVTEMVDLITERPVQLTPRDGNVVRFPNPKAD